MTLHVEPRPGQVVPVEAVVATIRDVTKLRGEVRVRAPGELPNDGKVVDDARTYA
jgi:phenylacetate-CoA ligase